MAYPFRFDRKTTIEALLYIAQRQEEPTLHSVYKVLYFAEKKHLEEYGRLITGDEYIAMKSGPVPSHAYEWATILRDRDSHGLTGPGGELSEAFDVVDRIRFISKRPPRLDIFSQSEVECLDYALRLCRGKDFDELSDMSHDESWRAADSDDSISIEALTLGLRDRDELLEHIRNPHP